MGRGSAMMGSILLLSLLMFQCCEVADAAIFTVGNSGGWTFNVATWSSGKKFKAGDIIIFNYSPALHNVVAVNKAGYQTCNPPTGSKVFTSGKDRIKLVKGANYFICSIPGHCQGGMKTAITAS